MRMTLDRDCSVRRDDRTLKSDATESCTAQLRRYPHMAIGEWPSCSATKDAILQISFEAAIAFVAWCAEYPIPASPLERQVISMAEGADDGRLLRGKCRKMLAICTRRCACSKIPSKSPGDPGDENEESGRWYDQLAIVLPMASSSCGSVLFLVYSGPTRRIILMASIR